MERISTLVEWLADGLPLEIARYKEDSTLGALLNMHQEEHWLVVLKDGHPFLRIWKPALKALMRILEEEN